MKKNIFSDNQSGKSSKGFYIALGISAVMIGSACFFAYNESSKIADSNNLNAGNNIAVSEAQVDRIHTDIPRVTTVVTASPVVTYATTAVTTAKAVSVVEATIPAADISVAQVPAETTAATEAEASLKNAIAPLSDMANVINPFSGSELVKNETTGSWQTHNGADISAVPGSEVFVVYDGEVTAVNNDPLWGVTVTIDHHNGFISKYCSLADDLSVQTGDKLVKGDVLGVIGDTADIESALEPHLHIELTHNGKYVDPLSYFPQ